MTQVFLQKIPECPPEKIDELEALIRKKFDLITGFGEPHQLSRAMQQMLRNYDLLEGEVLGLKEFKAALDKLNCTGKVEVVNGLFTRYDLKGEGTIPLKDLCDGLFGLKPVPGSSPDCREVMNKVRAKVLQRAGGAGFRGLTRVLRIMDDNGNKSLDINELKSGLQTYGVEITQPELQTAFRYFDRDKSGSVDVTEFLVGVRGRMSPQREQLVKLAYSRLERNGDGMVTMADLITIYKADKHPEVLNGHKKPEDVIREFASQWDKNGDDVVQIEEFIDYYNDISVSIDNDSYFELMIRNAWHISGGQGSAANTVNRRVLVTHLDGTQSVEEVTDDIGIDWSDLTVVKERLRKQGVLDILSVTL